MINIENLSKSYGTSAALHPIDVKIQAGCTTVLIGPSGCGKSTLLRLIIGLIRPDTGTIKFENEVITPESIGRLRHRMGYVIQEGGLFPHLTAESNVTIVARHLGWDLLRRKERVEELTELVRLPYTILNRYPMELSGGQRQRVSLMRALMLDPDVLLLDEPLGELDPMIRYELQQDLKAIFHGLGKTVLLVTHDIGEAGYFADTVVLLKEGCIVQQGSFHTLLNEPADPFVEKFVKAQRDPLQVLTQDQTT